METRERILRAAVRVFGDHGFRGATTRRIADEAGVNEVTLFRHFGSKERLVREALSAAGPGASAEVTEPDRGDGVLPVEPRDPVRELTAWSLGELRRLYAAQAVLRSSIAEFEERPDVAQCGTGLAERTAAELTVYLERLREAGHAAADFEAPVAASMLMGALFSDAISRDIMPARYPYDLGSAAREYTRIFLRGIGVGTMDTEGEGTG